MDGGDDCGDDWGVWYDDGVDSPEAQGVPKLESESESEPERTRREGTTGDQVDDETLVMVVSLWEKTALEDLLAVGRKEKEEDGEEEAENEDEDEAEGGGDEEEEEVVRLTASSSARLC